MTKAVRVHQTGGPEVLTYEAVMCLRRAPARFASGSTPSA